jgi:hypothetical protein
VSGTYDRRQVPGRVSCMGRARSTQRRFLYEKVPTHDTIVAQVVSIDPSAV